MTCYIGNTEVIMSGLCCSSDVRSLYLLIGEFVCPAFDMSMIRVSIIDGILLFIHPDPMLLDVQFLSKGDYSS